MQHLADLLRAFCRVARAFIDHSANSKVTHARTHRRTNQLLSVHTPRGLCGAAYGSRFALAPTARASRSHPRLAPLAPTARSARTHGSLRSPAPQLCRCHRL